MAHTHNKAMKLVRERGSILIPKMASLSVSCNFGSLVIKFIRALARRVYHQNSGAYNFIRLNLYRATHRHNKKKEKKNTRNHEKPKTICYTLYIFDT